MEGRSVQIRTNARQVAKNVSYTGGFLGLLVSLAALVIPLDAPALPTIRLVYFLVVLTKRLAVEMDSTYTTMRTVIEYRNVKAMVSIYLHIHVLLKVMDCF